MKKFIVLLCFAASAACFVSAGLYINRNNAGLVEDDSSKKSSTGQIELLSQINMPSYVRLPASFSNVDIVENLDDITVTENNVDDVMYETLQNTASHLAAVEGSGELLIVNYTTTKDSKVQTVEANYWLGYSEDSTDYDSTVYEGLIGTAIGETAHFEGVSFEGEDGVNVDITINDIYNMPYPVTDSYIAGNTEYSSVYNMRTELINDASGEAKEIARQQTINSLIETMMSQTTFIQVPDSLINKELEALQKENEAATYEDAKHNLNKIFFIAAVIDEYGVATNTEIEKRYEKQPESDKIGLSDYEIERMKYLLFEEDVVTYIYKKVSITNE